MLRGKWLLLFCLVVLALLMMACGVPWTPEQPEPEAMLYLLWGV